MEESASNNKGEEVVRLVDLLATIIRHRVWVYWTTGVGTLFAVVLLFVLPLVGFSLVQKTLTLQAAVRASVIPAAAQASFNIDIPSLVQVQASDLRSVAEVYRGTMMTDREAALAKPAFNRLVRNFIDRSFRSVLDNKTATVLLTLRVNTHDQEKGTKFLSQFLAKLQADLKTRTSDQINRAISALALSGTATTELANQARAPFQVAANGLKGVLADPDFPIVPAGDIEALEDEAGVSRWGLVFVSFLGSAFFGVILAFGAEAVNRTRRDPASRNLLQKAWRGE